MQGDVKFNREESCGKAYLELLITGRWLLAFQGLSTFVEWMSRLDTLVPREQEMSVRWSDEGNINDFGGFRPIDRRCPGSLVTTANLLNSLI